MECPHCRSEIDSKTHTFALGTDQSGVWKVSNLRCPTCDRLIVNLCSEKGATYPVLPQDSCRSRLSADVPAEWAEDYHTACQVLPHSPEASAALSRRLLHKLLSVKAGAGHGGLSDQIRQAVISSDLPPYIKQALQTLSRLAELEPDSPKSTRPEALASVTAGEAEWLLDISLAMLDLYFVQPAKMERRQAELERLIASATAPATETAPAAAQPAKAPASGGAAPAATGAAAAAPAATANPAPAAAATPPAPAAPATPSEGEDQKSGVSGSVSI